MRCQLEAYKNEVEIVRSDLKLELQIKEQHVRSLERNLADERLKPVKEKQTSSSIQSANNAEASDSVIDEHSVKLISIMKHLLQKQICFNVSYTCRFTVNFPFGATLGRES